MSSSNGGPDLTVLGRKVAGTLEAKDLEMIPAPPSITEVVFETNELCAMCPVTSQPDLYSMSLVYVPAEHLVESKTLKLYLMKYRNVGIFGEDLADMIATDIYNWVAPKKVTVVLQQQVRGGLTMFATAEYGRE